MPLRFETDKLPVVFDISEQVPGTLSRCVFKINNSEGTKIWSSSDLFCNRVERKFNGDEVALFGTKNSVDTLTIQFEDITFGKSVVDSVVRKTRKDVWDIVEKIQATVQLTNGKYSFDINLETRTESWSGAAARGFGLFWGFKYSYKIERYSERSGLHETNKRECLSLTSVIPKKKKETVTSASSSPVNPFDKHQFTGGKIVKVPSLGEGLNIESPPQKELQGINFDTLRDSDDEYMDESSSSSDSD